MMAKGLLLHCLLIYKTLVLVSAQDTNSSSSSTTVNPHYAQLLNYSMMFYEAQRSGKLPENNRITW
jgi:endoglucanase